MAYIGPEPINVRDGGTGVSTLAADGVLYGSGTSPVGVTSVGNLGEVLTSNGVGNPPSFQTATTPFSPNSVVDIVDDFFPSAGSTAGVFQWNTGGTAPGTATQDHPGVIHIPAVSGIGSPNYMYLGEFIGPVDQGSFVLGGGLFSLNFVLNLLTLSNITDTYSIYIGLMDVPSIVGLSVPPIDGIYFTYTDTVNSGNWQIVTIASSVSTTVNTAVPADTNYNNFGLVINAAGTSVQFFINGVSVGTIATTIPSANLSPVIFHNPTNGSPAGFDIDLFYSRLILTTPR
jgi:hypothetical protein